MANALGTLFGEIASAIREKNGETGTMKPAEFPEKISAIETGGGASGGGSLPAGVYMETENIRPKTQYYQLWFGYLGQLYAATLPYAGNGNNWSVYKYTNETWEEVVAEFVCNLSTPKHTVTAFEFGGVMHFLAWDVTAHYTFDGASFTKKNNLPGYGVSYCIHNGKLLAFVRSDATIYEWDETNDSWNVYVKTDGRKNSYCYIFSINNTLYYVYSDILYEVIDGAISKIGDWPRFVRLLKARNGRQVYLARNPQYGGAYELHEYNFTSSSDSILGYTTEDVEECRNTVPAKGYLRVIVGNDGTTSPVSSMILHIVEATE